MNMKINCDVIQDLMPLCAEGLASAESRALVDAHMKDCPTCRARCRAMEEPIPVPETVPLRAVRSQLTRRRTNAVLLAVCLAVLVLVSVFARLTEPAYTSASEVSVATLSDGTLLLRLSPDKATACRVTETDYEDVHCAVVTAWTTPLDRLLRATSPAMALPAGTEAVLYSLDSQDMVLLWGEDPFPDGGMMELPRLAPAFYVLLAAGLLVVLTPLAIALRHKKAGRLLACLAMAPWAFLIGLVCVKGFTTLSHDLPRDLLWILPVALAAWGALWTGLCLLRQRYES